MSLFILPREILLYLFDYLTMIDLKILKQTSRAIYEFISHEFGSINPFGICKRIYNTFSSVKQTRKYMVENLQLIHPDNESFAGVLGEDKYTASYVSIKLKTLTLEYRPEQKLLITSDEQLETLCKRFFVNPDLKPIDNPNFHDQFTNWLTFSRLIQLGVEYSVFRIQHEYWDYDCILVPVHIQHKPIVLSIRSGDSNSRWPIEVTDIARMMNPHPIFELSLSMHRDHTSTAINWTLGLTRENGHNSFFQWSGECTNDKHSRLIQNSLNYSSVLENGEENAKMINEKSNSGILEISHLGLIEDGLDVEDVDINLVQFNDKLLQWIKGPKLFSMTSPEEPEDAEII